MRKTLAALMLAVPASVLSTSVMSAAGVVEATPFTPGQTSAGGQAGAASSNDALVMLLDQFREMRAELETLRGMVEEQNYELRNLQRESLDRYTDLDSRMSALSSAAAAASSVAPVATQPGMPVNAGVMPVAPTGTVPMPSTAAAQGTPMPTVTAPVTTPAPMPQTTAPAVSASVPPVSAPVSTPSQQPIQQASLATANTSVNAQTPLQPTVLSEQQQYQMALDSLLQEEQYQRSVTEFDQYLRLYPSGRFVTNAYYWKGQAYINLAMLNEAREAFETIVNQYPDGRKVDDAMYSLGTVYDKLGNSDRARQLLRQVQSRFPNTSAANLADIYLRAMN
ncbi:MAG: tol-pal system protein YbgF [Pseudomonadales bacterium]|nr:tol-pal system protein YbgF [Pseudomonadales bacterium]